MDEKNNKPNQLSDQALNLLSQTFGRESQLPVSMGALDTVLEIRQWLAGEVQARNKQKKGDTGNESPSEQG